MSLTNILPLTNTQVMILKCLARNPNGLTREQLADKTGVVCDNTTLGPVMQETVSNHPESLVGYRLVKVEKISPYDPTVFKLTGGGEEAARAYNAVKRGQDDKVPPETLNPVVLSVRALKPYGLELFTDDDLKEIRSQLPEQHQDVKLVSLRQQIVNQRKQGAYSKVQTDLPQWYQEYREEDDFKIFAAKVLEYYDGCALDPKHREGLSVFHRRLFNDEGEPLIGMERVKDGIVLCARCAKRNHRFLCVIPEQNPTSEV